jgi:hypothetical protein
MFSEPGIDTPYPVGPESLPPTPRAVALNTKGRIYRVGLVCGLLFAPNAILAVGWFTGEDLRELEKRGEMVTGHVVAKHVSSGRGGPRYRVQYSYEVAGRVYGDSINFSKDESASLTRGDPYPVTYLPDRPQTNTPGRPGPRLRRHNENSVQFAALAAVVLAVVVVGFEFALRRERFLAREGEPVIGRITECGTTRGRNSVNYWVRHEFDSPGDDFVTDWHYVPHGMWERLRPGLRVTLLYDAACPKRHLPLYAFKYAYIVENAEDELSSPDSSAGITE